MPAKNKTVIAICIQEPTEDGSSMDMGLIRGADLRFLHQSFITDTITNSLEVDTTDVRLYFIGEKDRRALVGIVTDYLANKLTGKQALGYKDRFKSIELEKGRWGIRIEKVFADCFEAGYNSVLVIGSRTPTVCSTQMKSALKLLKESDAVFGPTPDGRYYVIGMSGKAHIKLSEFDWKSPSIYSEVSEAFTKEKLAWSELEIWYAVDTSEELEMMVRDINQFRFEGDDSTARETEVIMERILAKMEL